MCTIFFLLPRGYGFFRLRLRSCLLTSALTKSRLQSRLRPRKLPISRDKSRPKPLIVSRGEGGRRGCRLAREGVREALTGRSAAFLGERRYAHPPLPTPSNPQSPPLVPQGALALHGPRLKSPFGPSPPVPPPSPKPRPPKNQADVPGERLVQTVRLV